MIHMASNHFKKISTMNPKGVLVGAGRIYHRIRTRTAPEYHNPTISELEEIERRIQEAGITCHDFVVGTQEFIEFVQATNFPADYHGGTKGGVYYEKLLEHFVAWKFLNLGGSFQAPYMDVAACSSPWAKILHSKGIEAYAVDLSVHPKYSDLGYYRQEDATRTSFQDNSFGGASLQCAYEMFWGSQDIDLLRELNRILIPGGRAVISPLYMHTAPCFYQTPEYYGKPYGDPGSQGFIRRDCWGVPASRKYSPVTLKTRVWETATALGLLPNLYVLRNKKEIADGVYLHFILVLDKPPRSLPLKGRE
jgi:SAM-dependent methyltransferase